MLGEKQADLSLSMYCCSCLRWGFFSHALDHIFSHNIITYFISKCFTNSWKVTTRSGDSSMRTHDRIGMSLTPTPNLLSRLTTVTSMTAYSNWRTSLKQTNKPKALFKEQCLLISTSEWIVSRFMALYQCTYYYYNYYCCYYYYYNNLLTLENILWNMCYVSFCFYRSWSRSVDADRNVAHVSQNSIQSKYIQCKFTINFDSWSHEEYIS